MSSNLKVQRICQHCGMEFVAQTTTTRYCSHKCNSAAYKARKRNEKVAQSTQAVSEMKALTHFDILNKEYLKVREVAQLLQCSLRTTYRLIAEEKINSVNLGQRITRVRRTDIDALLLKKSITEIESIVEYDISECYTITEAQYKFGVSSKALLEIIKRNKIPRIKQGKFVYVPKERINKIFE